MLCLSLSALIAIGTRCKYEMFSRALRAVDSNTLNKGPFWQRENRKTPPAKRHNSSLEMYYNNVAEEEKL